MTQVLHFILDFIQNNADVISAALVSYFAGASGLVGFALKKIVSKGVEYLAKLGKKEVQKIDDKEIIKEGNELEQKPVTPEVEKDRQENLLDLINGGKK